MNFGQLICLTILSPLSLAGGASAQDQPSSTRDIGKLEEIIVTAQKREQNQQDVAASISTFSAERVANSKIEEFSDVVSRVPSLSVNTVSKGQSFASLRGASVSQPSVSGGQSVGLMIDDVPYTTSADWDLSLYEIERLEVLRGPQGTLFGRNVVGGLLNIVTQGPGDEFSGSMETSIGNYDRFDIRGSLNVPLSDSFKTRLSAFRFSNSGTSSNRTTGNDIDDTDKHGLRLQTLYEGQNWELAINGEYSRDNSSGSARDYVGPAPLVPFYASYVPDDDQRTVTQSFDPDYDDEAWVASARLSYDFGATEFVSITSYRERDQFYSSDFIGVPDSPFVQFNFVDLSQFSQELRLVNDEGRFKWAAGAFYMNLDLSENNFDQFRLESGSPLGDAQACFRNGSASAAFCEELFGLGPGDLAIPPDPAFAAQPRINERLNTKTDSIALFAEGTLGLRDDLNLTLGVRYSYDDTEGSASVAGDTFFALNPEGSYATVFGDSWDAFTYKVSLDYEIAPEKMIYATVSRGYKAGVFVVGETAALTATPIDPEFAMNYEIGAKTQWLDDRVRLNLSAFMVDYTDQQVFIIGEGGQAIVENAGKVEVEGVEVDLEAVPIDNLRIWASYAYSDGVVKDLPEFDGNDPAQLPPHALTLGGAYTVPVSSLAGELTFQAELLYKSQYFLEVNNTPQFETQFDNLIDANLTYTSDGGRFAVSLWGKNLTDETVVVYGQDLAPLFILTGAEPGAAVAGSPRYNQPRMYGLTVRARF